MSITKLVIVATHVSQHNVSHVSKDLGYLCTLSCHSLAKGCGGQSYEKLRRHRKVLILWQFWPTVLWKSHFLAELQVQGYRNQQIGIRAHQTGEIQNIWVGRI